MSILFFVKFNRKRRIKLKLIGNADVEKLLNDFIYNTIDNNNYYYLCHRLFKDGYNKLTIVS